MKSTLEEAVLTTKFVGVVGEPFAALDFKTPVLTICYAILPPSTSYAGIPRQDMLKPEAIVNVLIVAKLCPRHLKYRDI